LRLPLYSPFPHPYGFKEQAVRGPQASELTLVNRVVPDVYGLKDFHSDVASNEKAAN